MKIKVGDLVQLTDPDKSLGFISEIDPDYLEAGSMYKIIWADDNAVFEMYYSGVEFKYGIIKRVF